jgi:hypothetical protein
MLNYSETSPGPRIVRWTDDEWARIASHLYSQRRTGQFEPLDLKEVKAKDIFMAQQVLPPDRHRRLVSIAQGFDAIRTRLRIVHEIISRTHGVGYGEMV